MQNQNEYERGMQQFEELMGKPELSASELALLQKLADEIGAYEDEFYPLTEQEKYRV